MFLLLWFFFVDAPSLAKIKGQEEIAKKMQLGMIAHNYFFLFAEFRKTEIRKGDKREK